MQDIPKKIGLGISIIDGPNNIYCNRLGLSLAVRFADLNFLAKSFKHVLKVLKASSYRCFYLILLRPEKILDPNNNMTRHNYETET